MSFNKNYLFIKSIILIFFLSTSLLSDNGKTYGYLIDGSRDFRINNSTKLIKLLIDDIFKKENFNFRVKLYKNYKEISKDYFNGEIALLNMDSYFYITNKKELDKVTDTIWTIYQDNNSPLYKFYLIVNKKSNIKSYKDLKNKKVAVRKDNYWAKTFFFKQSKYNKFDFIDLKNEKTVLLQTFFNKFDACIISSNVYDLMVELNPSIRKKLIKFDESDLIFLRYLVLVSNKIPKKEAAAINERIGMYRKLDARKDIQKFFNVTSAKEIQKEDFSKVENFYKEFLDKR